MAINAKVLKRKEGMSAINKAIPRGLQVLFIAVILAVLVWKFATNTDYFYFAIGGAALITLILGVAIYSAKPASNEKSETKSAKKENPDELIPDENLDTSDMALETVPAEAGPNTMSTGFHGIRTVTEKPDAHDVTLNYFRMAAIAKAREEEANTWHPKPKTIEDAMRDVVANRPPTEPVETDAVSSDVPAEGTTEDVSGEVKAETAAEGGEAGAAEGETTSGEKAPLIVDETVLSEEEKSALENAVWYRCENPYCSYTHFLDVHHITEEKNGGTNKLDNLIVLCPFCHALAHKNEIPEEEMRSWIANREDRFKEKLEWKYF
jgi:hypothetical protein